MTPTPQETMVENRSSKEIPRPLSGEEVVISGMSGIFPRSDSVLQFMENLYNKVDMVTDEDPRWIFNHPELPTHLGKVNGMGKFDAQFFRVHYKQACTMEPMSRKLLEHTYSAIYDSGINPLQLRGKKVGVFIGSTFSESEKIVIYETIQRNGFGITGCNKAMYANRISYWIDGKGPSYALDVACASSMACLEHAYRSISTGQCEAAIVGGCNLCMHPNVSLNLKRAGFLCLDGKTKCFDKNGDGYVRSDAISVLFLQKAKDAKRIYSEVYHAKGNYQLQPDSEFLPKREPKDIREFLEAFYSEINVSPKDVEYVEAYGAAIAEADGNELEAIGQVFGKEKPIKTGSVKSNMGNSEPASGVCALTKVCLAYHKGELPANLHYYESQDHIPSVRDGKVEVLNQHVPFKRGFAALNSFAYTGANVHVLLKGRYIEKDNNRYNTNLPYIVLASGRQEHCVKKVLDILKEQPIDPEQIGLLHNIHHSDIPGHMCRGYTILSTKEEKKTVSLAQSVDYYAGSTPPVWFVYSGMGSQWAGMGAHLMRIPIFAAAIEKCRKVLEPKGIDIVHILTSPDKTIYDNILNSFVGIAAVQIGLTDVLREMGIVPDNIIGHSVGELGCAYADGCFTAEEMILAAYSRGLVSVQTPLITGSMAAVGLGYKTVLPMCPPEIEVACHNSSESSTISGPAEAMKKFVGELSARGVFAREVPCSNIAYHSRYIADAGPGLLKYLSEVIKEPKERSKKWLSTSIPQDRWDEPIAKYSSAEYHTNNLLNSVLFEETAKMIPANALVIEVAPHGLLQAILKRSHSECTHIPLTRRGHDDSVKFLLEAIGKLYQSGLNPKVDVLYPKIVFPVSTETPLLSHFVEWEHSEDWPQAKYNTKDRVVATAREFVMSIHDDDFKYFEGHVRDGSYVFPEAALLVLVWETLAMHRGVNYTDLSVIFKDIKFHGEANIRTDVPLKLGLMIHKGNNKFEVSYENVPIVSGCVSVPDLSDTVNQDLDELPSESEEIFLNTEDIYKMLRLRGHCYKNEFQTIHSSNMKLNQANIKWDNEWITFLDSLIQLNIVSNYHAGISTPKIIKKLFIDVEKHEKATPIITADGVQCYKAEIHKIHNITRCGGVKMDHIVFIDKPIVESRPDVLQTKSFVPHFITGEVDLKTALQINFQIIDDNISDTNIQLTEMFDSANEYLHNAVTEATDKIPSTDFFINSSKADDFDYDVLKMKNQDTEKTNIFIVNDFMGDEKKMKALYNIASENVFVLTFEENLSKIHPKNKMFNIITAMSVNKKILILLKKAVVKSDEISYVPITQDNKFSWVHKLQSELLKSKRIVLVSERQPYCGLLGLVKKLIKKYGNKIGLVVVDDYHAPTFSLDNSLFKEQLKKNLTLNVLRKGQWGGYYYIPSSSTTIIQNVKLMNTQPGDIDKLEWIEATPTSTKNNLVQVYYTGPSYRDALKAVGKVKSEDRSFGMDFSGIDKNGKRVMGLIREGAISSTVEADPNLLWPVPDHWTLEDAATVPLPYIHAYYCLAIRSNFVQNSSVFVNGGTGALGQAIISLCLAIGNTVYTAVSDIHKKKFLMKLFPGLDEKNIGYSRDASFRDTVIKGTNDRKCDIVINCASGNLRKATMDCAGYTGIVLDLNEHDMNENNDFGMYYLSYEKTYKSAHLSNIFKPENLIEKKKLQIMISEGIAKGIIRPISRIVYAPSEVSRAFRLLSTSRHIGRVLLKMRDPMTLNHDLNVLPRVSLSSKSSHVVVCDDNGLGIELVERLIQRGARNMIVHQKSSSLSGYFCIKLASWKNLGVNVKLSFEILQTEKGCMNMFKENAELGSVHNIFIIQSHVSRVIEDNFQQDVATKFNETALVVANLDMISRNVCPELNNFVVITRASDNITNEFVTSATEKICQSRNDLGLSALVLRIENLDQLDQNLENVHSKTQPQTISTVFNALEISLKLKYNYVITFNLNKRTSSDILKKLEIILGMHNVNADIANLTLNDLNVNDVIIGEIKALIKNEFKMTYTDQKIRNMTIVSLKNLAQNFKKRNTNFHGGLEALYTLIDEDECMATEPMVAMPTKLSNANQEEQELDTKATYLMLIPGFEGHHHIFLPICERLKVQAMTFQLGPDQKDESIQQMASNIMKFMKKRFELKSKFYLLGYSFGVNVALELAALMEKEGYVGVVYCLDSSPESLKIQLDAYIGDLTDSQLQDSIVRHMYKLMSGRNSDELEEDLKKTDDWDSKVDACVKRLRGIVNYSHQYKKSILQAAYNRIKMARAYEPNFVLKSELVLIKGIPHPNAKTLANDYNLSKYTEQEVKVYNIESDHALATQDCRVSNIVNRLLEPKVLEEFKRRNLCETYLADPFKIL